MRCELSQGSALLVVVWKKILLQKFVLMETSSPRRLWRWRDRAVGSNHAASRQFD